MPERVDPITLGVLWNSLVSVADEMGTALQHTAFSAAIREAEDFSTGLFDRRGRLIAQGHFSPGHLGSMPFVVKSALEVFPIATLQPGDGILINDSALGSGHYPDVFLVTPVFGTELIGFAVNCAHHADVGGAAAGSQMVAVTEAYQEGIRILPVRIFRQGKIDADLERLILGNVRLPDSLRGNLMAQRNANHIGALRLAELHDRYGQALFESVIEEILDRTEAALRTAIARIPEGEYTFEDNLDDSGPGTDPVRVSVVVTVGNGKVVVDFSGSSAQVAAGINSYLNYTRAYAVFAIKVFTDPFVPQNEGAFRVLDVVAEPGSFFNPVFPAPSGGRATVQIRIFEAINGALATALPNIAMGAFSHWSNPNLGGPDDGTGRPFVMYDLILGGYGAWAESDGAEALCPVFNARNIPVEVHESGNPVRIERLEFITDSAGPGRYRGGCGVRKDVRMLAPATSLTNLTDRTRFPGYGLFGGAPGALALTLMDPGGSAVTVGSKAFVRLQRDQVISFRTNGAGGYGPSLERDPLAVLRDVEDGLVSVGQAREAYGVIIDPGGLTLDHEGTADLRARRGRG